MKAGWIACVAVAATAAYANPPPVPLAIRKQLEAATALVLPSRCTGAVVEATWLVVTAKHCIDDGAELRVRVAGVYFHGNPQRPRWQAARLDRIARCSSLPDLPRALHTSIDGTPGDSGAPLVDLLGRVIGLVHGGTRCRIATSGDRLARLVDRVLERQHASVRTRPLLAPGRSASPAS